jgi:uncharacterized protein (TIGR00661 family)
MRILYGVVGEGMGHATRSRVVLEHLTQKHDVHIVVSGRARDYLAKRFENVHNIWGFTIQYEENSVKKWQTVLQNLKGAVTGWPQNVKKYFELVESFSPDVVISDFESFSYLFGRAHRLPVISVDNMQIINRCDHPGELIGAHEADFELIRSIVRRRCRARSTLRHHLFYPPVRAEDDARSVHLEARDHRRPLRAGGAPPRLPDRHREHRARRDPQGRGDGVPDLRVQERPEGGRARRFTALPAVQRGRVHR